jgi:large subunit ribosomal protein L10
MLRQKKHQVVQEMEQIFSSRSCAIVLRHGRLNANEIREVRRLMRAVGGFRVTKKSLLNVAWRGTVFHPMITHIDSGPTAVGYSNDPVTLAKVVMECTKKFPEKLIPLIGYLDGQQVNPADIRAFSELPSLDVARSRLVGLVVAPAQRLLSLLQEPAAQIARMAHSYATKEQ